MSRRDYTGVMPDGTEIPVRLTLGLAYPVAGCFCLMTFGIGLGIGVILGGAGLL